MQKKIGSLIIVASCLGLLVGGAAALKFKFTYSAPIWVHKACKLKVALVIFQHDDHPFSEPKLVPVDWCDPVSTAADSD